MYKFDYDSIPDSSIRKDSLSRKESLSKTDGYPAEINKEFYSYSPTHDSIIQDCKLVYGNMNSSDFRIFVKK